MPLSADQLPNRLLENVSRSFYLTLRVLPARIRPQIGLAYLLARTTDTIADTELVPLDQRLAALEALRERILGRRSTPLDFGELARRQGAPAERVLLEQTERSLALLATLEPADRQPVRDVLRVITSGQELDLRRFAAASSRQVVALATDAELEDYTYRVAGCVGEFWTRMCRAHLFPEVELDETQLLAEGVQFGQGLQLVNVLRDLPADLRQGRCYLPEGPLREAGLLPQHLLDPANEPRLRPLYGRYLDLAETRLQAGWTYTNRLPYRCVRVRLACAWPILIGRKTIARLRVGPVLDPEQRVKISRREVKQILFRSVLCYPFPGAWRGLAPRGSGAGGSSDPLLSADPKSR